MGPPRRRSGPFFPGPEACTPSLRLLALTVAQEALLVQHRDSVDEQQRGLQQGVQGERHSAPGRTARARSQDVALARPGRKSRGMTSKEGGDDGGRGVHPSSAARAPFFASPSLLASARAHFVVRVAPCKRIHKTGESRCSLDGGGAKQEVAGAS